MKLISAVVLMATAVSPLCLGQEKPKVSSDSIVKAVEGARLLHSEMRDPDSFKISKAWIMQSEKYGMAVCYEYFSRNGFGGMNASAATYFRIENRRYAERHHRDYELVTDVDFEQTARWDEKCGSHAAKHDAFLGDVTAEVTAALSAVASQGTSSSK